MTDTRERSVATVGPSPPRCRIPHRAALIDLASCLADEGSPGRAHLLLDHLHGLDPTDEEVRAAILSLAGGAGKAPTRHRVACAAAASAGLAAARSAAIAGIDLCREAGDVAGAEHLAAALAEAFPTEPTVLAAAVQCNLALGQAQHARVSAEHLAAIEPLHPATNALPAEHHAAAGDQRAEAAHRARLALAQGSAVHPVKRLHDIHAALSLRLLDPLDGAGWAEVAALAAAAERVEEVPTFDPALAHWGLHYRLLSVAADPRLLAMPAPTPRPLALAGCDGRPVAAALLAQQPGPVFLAAADERYLRLYGRLFARSVLAACDLPCTVLLHAIGGQARLTDIIAAVGLDDSRLVWSADMFDAAAVTTLCQDSDGPRPLPVAHFQSARFARAYQVLAALGRPLLVADVDSVLQRGVGDLLARHADADVVLNLNGASAQFGSRLTANLALFNPTGGARSFLTLLRNYLAAALSRPAVSRWIDQCGLQMAWQGTLRGAPATRFAWFDTDKDINNVMYRHWQPNPFRFLSLFHGFDLDSLPPSLSAG